MSDSGPGPDLTALYSVSLQSVQARIDAALARSRRPPGSAELIAVSKKHPPAAIAAFHALGQRSFGENYAQELRDKAAELGQLRGLLWHAIGPLQVNKAKYIAQVAHVFHALERIEVAEELSRRRTGAPLLCYVEVNLAGEQTKRGLAPEAVAPFVDAVRALPRLEVVGLMCLPPFTETPEHSRSHFRALAALALRCGLRGLSMGTTADFEVAIEEGATAVRVGTALFGERPAPKP